jgi:phage tail-like protein
VSTSTYPIPTYRYRLMMEGCEMIFAAVSGLDMSVETTEYIDGTGSVWRMPGQTAVVNISLQRGTMRGYSSQLVDWLNSNSLSGVEMKNISISLLAETGNEALVTWNVVNALPTKFIVPNSDASSAEIAIEELSLMGDRVTVQF